MTKICLKCDKEFEDSDNFCIACGGELTDISNVEEKIDKLKNEIIDSIKKQICRKFSNFGLYFTSSSVIKPVAYEKVETQEIKNKHSTGTKVLATAVAGPLGFAATSGIKQQNSMKKVKKEAEYLHIYVNISDKKIIYNTYVDNEISNSFNLNKGDMNRLYIKWEDVDFIEDDYYLILKNHDPLKFPMLNDKDLVDYWIKKISDEKSINKKFIAKHYLSIERTIDAYYKELINDKAKNSENNSNTSNNSDLDELERIANLYNRGLLTEEEFAIMKKKIIYNE